MYPGGFGPHFGGDMYEIEKNVPIPPEYRRTRESKYPLKKMAKGDSFLIPVPADAPKESYARAQQSVQSYASRWKIKVTTRKIDGGVRVWRIE